MKKSLRILRVVLLAVIVLVILVGISVHLFVDRALKMGIEVAGTKALNVAVSVDDVDLSILGGSVGFGNLVIDNPEGYRHDRLLELKDAHVAVRLKSLMSDVVNIKDIKLVGVNVVLEQKGLSNNLQDIVKSIPAGDEKKEAEPSGKKLHIDNLELSEVEVKVKFLPVPGRVDTIPIKLDPIRMTHLGSDDKLDAAGLMGKILVAIAGGIAEQGAGILPDEIIGSLRGELKRLGSASADLGKDVLDGTKDIGKGITDGIGGLFKPKKKEDEKTEP
ncbi:MAG: hypothetical protein ACYTBJ_10765 [Planctomycetota bacterium]